MKNKHKITITAKLYSYMHNTIIVIPYDFLKDDKLTNKFYKILIEKNIGIVPWFSWFLRI